MKVFTKNLLLMVFVLLSSFTVVNSQTVSGVVTDSKTGDPIIGANILIKGTSTGTITDLDGGYSIDAQEGQTLVISYIGFNNQEVVVGSSSTIDISLVEGEVLDEVVVVGYGTVKKKDATGAVASIGTRDFQKGIVISSEQLMQGRVAGVQIAQNSGEPGGGISVRIRGTSSVYGANQPLIVIDGVPISGEETSSGNNASGVGRQPAKNPLNFLNPSDIETFDILKDASATAIYGSRGANGVILITTKRGKGKGSVDYNYSLGVSNITKKYDLLNASEYVAAGGQNTGFDTDWQNELFRTGITNQHNLSFGGGDANSNYRFSAGYFKQNGIVLNSALERYSAGFNGTKSFLSDKVKISTFINLSNTKDKNVPISENIGFTGDLMGNILKFNPTNPVFDEKDADGDGDKTEYFQPGITEVNPLAFVNLSKDNTNTLRALGNLQAEITITDGLKFRSIVGTDRALSNRKAAYSKDLITEANAGLGRAYFSDIDISNNIWENYFTYDKSAGNITFGGLLGYSYQSFDNKQKRSAAARYSTSDLDVMINNLGDADISVLNNSSNEFNEIQSYFGRINVGFSDKYMITATLRTDGSTRFGGENQYGFFPSFAAKWKLNKPEKTIPKHFG
ncbi:MAG: SusC/RagA family TonB-linked outer membrane protein [Saprospiraceae bacterium]